METRYLPIFSPEVKTAWEKIEKDVPGLNPFMYYGFQSHLAERLRPWTAIGLHSVKAICVYDYGRIMGILPFVRRNTDGKMRLLGDIKGCGINDMVIAANTSQRQEYADMAVDKFLSLSKAGKGKLRRLPPESPVVESLRLRTITPVSTTPCVRIPLPDSYDDWAASLSKSVRQNLRTAYNRLKRDGHVISFHADTYGKRDGAVYSAALSLYARRQASAYTSGGKLKKLFREIKIRHFDKTSDTLGRLDNSATFLLKIDGVPAACMSGLLSHDGGLFVVPRLAVDSAFKFYSPGYLLLSEAIKHFLSTTDVRIIDLSRGNERYKTDLGGEIYHTSDYKNL